MKVRYWIILGALLFIAAAALVVWDTSTPAPVAAQGGDDECDGPCPDWIVEAWAGSGHANAEAEAFRHWDEEDPKEVPTSCAKCHSEGGYLDFLGADDTEAGVVDNAAPVDTVVSCTVCHNPAAIGADSVVFPSGVEVVDVGPSARCMECHQGRSSGAAVAAAVEGAAVGPDEISADLGFINIHYFAAAASLFGSEVGGGYQYEGMAYQTQFEHVPGYDSCANCHSPHTLEVKVAECATCHVDVASAEDLKAIRMPGSLMDYDGDGDTQEGTFSELEGLQEKLYMAIQAYGSEVAGTAIVYNPQSHPYFFIDSDGDGAISAEETDRYASWTPRLLQAAYNFQMYEKDPGAFAHNAKYHVQLMYDSIASLNEALAEPVDIAAAHRNSAGHFDGTAEAFRHWDEDGEVPATCVKCHTSEGLPFLAEHGVVISEEPSTSLACSTCHTNFQDWTLYVTDEVTFPSGAVLSFGEGVPSNLCINCHQGRESTVSVDAALAAVGVGDDEVSDAIRFRNVHYFAAGATLFGTDAKGVYEYEGKEYLGRFAHVPGVADTCTSCHTAHRLSVKVEDCTMCHAGIEETTAIRMTSGDFDGDGADEGVAGEIVTMHEALLAAIQAYAADVAGTPIAYNPAQYPYWFVDANANGVPDADEGDGYATWTPTLLRAAYNYQYVAKDPGAYVHNGKYVAQVLYDSLEAVGGEEAVAGMMRP
ncbi:MAG: hypothetical protein JXQ72_08355 [Anaerolineae bacterium]|nr:hypothetical protein [Anaerolineae bacterium]